MVSRAILGESVSLHRLGDVVLRKKGERKKRKAMRRLLRAAGVTYPPAITIKPVPIPAGADRAHRELAEFCDGEIRRALGGS